MSKLDGTEQVSVLNGSEGGLLEWSSIDWSAAEESVRRLRQRIFKASQDGDLKKVRNLQKLMLRSRSNTLVSVRRVTQQSSGRRTAGVDGMVVLTPKGRAQLASDVHNSEAQRNVRPVRRVYIPKSNGKQRPLGIPVIRDRVHQARVKNALEPEWEARFEARSYGFRPGRGCHDAVEAIFSMVKGKAPKRTWALDADLAAAFDRINHDRLMEALGGFPARGWVRAWLKSGILENGRFAPTDEGTPQGGVVSPLLLNIALHGMEEAAGVRYRKRTGQEPGVVPGTPVLVRYADDFVVLTHTKEEAEEVKTVLAKWLERRGLRFNEDKTRIVSLNDGFDFLGFTVRRRNGDRAIIMPSKDAVQKIRERLRREVRELHGSNAEAVILRLAPIIRGWGAYYRTVVSSRTFSKLDDYLWKLTYRWAKRAHPLKSKHWVTGRYFGRFNKTRENVWVFGNKKNNAYLTKFTWIPIVRHSMVKGAASPDDPALQEYWARRRHRKAPPPMDRTSLTLAARQKGLCPLCNKALIDGAEYEPDSPREWMEWFAASKKMLHKHHFVYRRDGGGDEIRNLRLVHAECHRLHHAQSGTWNPHNKTPVDSA